MEKIKKERTPRGTFIGRSALMGYGLCDVFVDKGHFGISVGSKFIKHIKASVLKAAGIFVDKKRVYDSNGYVGCQKR